MRDAFIETLVAVAQADERIWLLTGDLGYSVLHKYHEQLPQRYVNVGVAEQNLAGIAAGLATTGKIVFTYSIANFPTLRCLEQIRNDIGYHGLPVKVVAVGGGYAYGPQGYTHHGVEDLGILRTLPGLTVVAPGDPVETRLAVPALVQTPGPCYLRLGKAREQVVHAAPPAFALGQAIQLRDGRDLTLISTGGMLPSVVAAADRLAAEHGVQARVLSMHTLKPLDAAAVRRAARDTRVLVTAEEHSVTNGLGTAVADVLATSGAAAVLRKIGIPDQISHAVGSQEYLRARCGDVVGAALAACRGAPPCT